MNKITCQGCIEEMEECYKWQNKGYDAGLDWFRRCCFVFVLNKQGEFIVS